MDKETMIKYAPVALIVVGLIIQWNMFATPTDIERKHREILKEVQEEYVLKEQYNSQYNDLKRTIGDMQNKVDKIYDAIIGRK